MDAIKIEGLTKRYKDTTAVDNLSFSVKKGELFSLLGVNGAGKTTTIKMLCTLTEPTGGDALLNGKSICKESASVKKIIAVSPQETAVAPLLTVYENLELICAAYNVTKQERAVKIKEISERLGLEGVTKKRAGRLSGGLKRRLSIAMALIGEPEILFLDEPTLGLDVLSRSDLWKLIKYLKGKVTIVLTTHYMQEAEELSDRIGIMKDGRLLVCDTPENIKSIAGVDSIEKAFISFVQGV